MKADIYDALNLNTRATGNWEKGKAPNFPAWPRPNSTATKPEEKKPVSVADIYRQFQRR